MDESETYDCFGRDVPFDELPIKKLYQPGIISSRDFFDPEALDEGVKESLFFRPEKVRVYFNDIIGGIGPKDKPKERHWSQTFQEFKEILKEGFPAGMQVLYDHGNGSGKARTTPFIDPQQRKDYGLYQARLHLFDGAIRGFSCFVWQNEEGMSLRSERNTYEDVVARRTKELYHDGLSMWEGRSDVLLQAGRELAYSLQRTNRDYTRGFCGRNMRNPEIRIVIPGRGALVSRLVKDSSVTVRVTQKDLEAAAKDVERRREKFALIR
ncbi:MAG: hypothetical protein AABW73_01785 [Nanoarchaeota archaeon]